MAVIAEGTVTVKESADGEIESVLWAIHPWPVSGGQPSDVSYLRHSHGRGSPQSLVMTVGGEEVIMFWAAPEDLAQRVHKFLKQTQRTTITGIDTDGTGNPTPREWEVECSVFQDYMDTLIHV